MAEAVLESRVRIELENLSFVITVDEAEELFDQLQDVLPDRGTVMTHIGGSFGFAAPNEEESPD